MVANGDPPIKLDLPQEAEILRAVASAADAVWETKFAKLTKRFHCEVSTVAALLHLRGGRNNTAL